MKISEIPIQKKLIAIILSLTVIALLSGCFVIKTCNDKKLKNFSANITEKLDSTFFDRFILTSDSANAFKYITGYLNVSPLRLDGNNTNYPIASIKIINERKKIEQELIKLNEVLEHIVKLRTQELKIMDEQLVRRNKVFVGRELKMKKLYSQI